LQLEYYVLPGDSLSPENKRLEMPTGLLTALRGAYIRERGGASAYAEAAKKTKSDGLRELYLRNAQDETSHAEALRRLIESVMR
jgi:rubrerythrin